MLRNKKKLSLGWKKTCSHILIFVEMLSKRGKVGGKKLETRTSDDVENLEQIDVFYNPDIVDGLLYELQHQVDSKCAQLQRDSDFMTISIRQAFHLELIKLPTQVKNMSLTRFREEYGDSLDAVTRSAIGGLISKTKYCKSNTVHLDLVEKVEQNLSSKVFQTPSGSQQKPTTLGFATAMRNPKEGERLLSQNGSPLGEFQTVVKASKPVGLGLGLGSQIVPSTPGVFIPLETGDIIDMENLDISNLSRHHKDDALIKMQLMMDNIRECMTKLQR